MTNRHPVVDCNHPGCEFNGRSLFGLERDRPYRLLEYGEDVDHSARVFARRFDVTIVVGVTGQDWCICDSCLRRFVTFVIEEVPV